MAGMQAMAGAVAAMTVHGSEFSIVSHEEDAASRTEAASIQMHGAATGRRLFQQPATIQGGASCILFSRPYTEACHRV